MNGFGPSVYVPIIWTKQGERTALAHIDESVKPAMRPLLVPPPVDRDFDSGKLKKSVREHLSKLPEQLSQSWGGGSAFIDLVHIDDRPIGPLHPLDWFMTEASQAGLDLTPVVSLTSTSEYRSAVAKVVAREGKGVCLRLAIGCWPSVVGVAEVDSLLGQLGLQARDAHLVLDVGGDTGPAVNAAVTAELRGLPHALEWRSVAVAGTAMPSTMPTGPGLHVRERTEWTLYERLRGLSAPLVRAPSFGDYVVGGISPTVDVDPRFMNISATLRYTVEREYLIAKGGLFKGNGGRSLGGAAVAPAAALLMSDSRFFAQSHCSFESWMVRVVAGGTGGNPSTWRRYGTEHHLVTTVNQLATFHGS